jgi:hypothetical protein
MNRRSALTLALILAIGCGESPGEPADTTFEPSVSVEPSISVEPSQSPEVSPLIGTWTRPTTCQELVAALEDAGLGDLAPETVAGNGLVPGTPKQLAAKDDLCEGAVPREHSHFFTPLGIFGSLDWNLRQVDDGTYELVDERTFTIGDATFHFRVNGDKIRFVPVLPDDCAQVDYCSWMIAVAFPGHSWTRTY